MFGPSKAARPATRALLDLRKVAFAKASLRPLHFSIVSPEFQVMDLSDAELFAKRYRKHTERSGLDHEAHKALVPKVWDRRPDVVDTMKNVAFKARAKGIPMRSHDDTQAETRKFYHRLGATTSEFPMTMGLVEQARANGD